MEINPAAQAGAVAAELGAVVADAKRAAVLGASGESAERGGELNLDLNAFKINRTVQSASPLAVAIEGPGLFVLQDGARRLYGRLGDFRADERGALIDSRGRAVLGYRVNSLEQPISGAISLAAEPGDMSRQRFSEFSIDARGIFSGIVRRVDARTGVPSETAVPIGRIVLAIFPAPERLARDGDTALRATRAAGLPSLFGPGDVNVGVLRNHALESGMIDVAADLKKLWTLRQLAEAQVTLAAANDAFARTALGLVK